MTGDELAQRVAEAADAWLRDPADSEVYRRLVVATPAWRAHARPTLDGLERAGDVPDVAALSATVRSVLAELRARAVDVEEPMATTGGTAD